MITSQSDQLVTVPHSPTIEPLCVHIVRNTVRALESGPSKSLFAWISPTSTPSIIEVVVESEAIALGQTSSSSLGNKPEQFVERLEPDPRVHESRNMADEAQAAVPFICDYKEVIGTRSYQQVA